MKGEENERDRCVVTCCPSVEDYRRAVSVLEQGGIVAFPTETFYGLAVDPFNEQALGALFRLKNRPLDKPFLVLIQKQKQLADLASSIPTLYRPLMEAFWPGPLTLVFPAGSGLSPLLTGGSSGIAVRISSHPVAMKFSQLWGSAFTATSANMSGMSAACNAEEVRQIFGNKIGYILDGGQTAGGKSSTVLGIQQEKLYLIRDGVLDFSFLAQMEK